MSGRAGAGVGLYGVCVGNRFMCVCNRGKVGNSSQPTQVQAKVLSQSKECARLS